jgi:uncharacterized protein (TIGR03546 family)
MRERTGASDRRLAPDAKGGIMLQWLLPPARLAARAFIAHASPRQLAGGVAIGMLLGLVPQGNLTALVLAVVLFSFRFHLGAGLASALVFSWLGTFFDPVAHRIGWQILSYGSLQLLYAKVYELPLVPWSGLNNTVVLGQLVLGLYAVYPVYWLTTRCDARWRAPAAEWVRKHRLLHWLLDAQIASRVEVCE